MATQQEDKSSKLLLGMVAGAIIGGAVMMLKSDNRDQAKQKASGMKETVSGFASEVKEDPKGTRDQFLDRVKDATNTLKEAVNNVQEIYDKFNGDIKDQIMQVKEESQDVVSQAKDAGEQLKESGEKVVEAKDELVGEDDDSQSGSGSGSDNNRLQ